MKGHFSWSRSTNPPFLVADQHLQNNFLDHALGSALHYRFIIDSGFVFLDLSAVDCVFVQVISRYRNHRNRHCDEAYCYESRPDELRFLFAGLRSQIESLDRVLLQASCSALDFKLSSVRVS